MKKFLSVAVLSVVTALLSFSQLGCARPQNTNTNTVAVATPEPTPDKAAIEAELRKIENDWPRMIKERDGAAVRRIEADDVFIVYPDGSIGNREQDAKDIEAGTVSADSWEISDLKVNVLNNDSAVVSLRNIVKNGKIKAPDGKLTDISGQYRSLDTFARRNGQWQLVATSSVKIQSPGASASPTPKTSPTPKASPSPGASPAMKAIPSPKATPAAKTSPVMKPAPTPAKTKTP